jgi:hypothetical protein
MLEPGFGLKERKILQHDSMNNGYQARKLGLHTYCHVWPTPSISCLGNGVHKLSTDPKVTEFNISTSVQKNIGRFDICKR